MSWINKFENIFFCRNLRFFYTFLWLGRIDKEWGSPWSSLDKDGIKNSDFLWASPILGEISDFAFSWLFVGSRPHSVWCSLSLSPKTPKDLLKILSRLAKGLGVIHKGHLDFGGNGRIWTSPYLEWTKPFKCLNLPRWIWKTLKFKLNENSNFHLKSSDHTKSHIK